ncbi:MAG: SUMF1/EgtB/PvdO family nonheme iron enzyme [Acidobacteriota bacterium]
MGRLEEVVLEVPLYTDEQIGDSMVYVPPGPFLMGEGTARRRVDLPGFFVARLPVTFAAYCEYLDWLQENAPDDVARHAPRDAVNGRFVRGTPAADSALDPLPPPGTSGVMDPEIPVMSVSWYSAVAYAGWRSMMDDRRYDLPAEAEWEKAARGTDGRAYPWGNRFDPTLCKMARTRPGVAQPAPAGLFPHNVSPYGMGEAAGGVFNWTLDWFDDSQQWKVVRGGSWGQDEASCRTFTRRWGEPAAGYSSHGIRLCSRQPASSRTKRGRR